MRGELSLPEISPSEGSRSTPTSPLEPHHLDVRALRRAPEDARPHLRSCANPLLDPSSCLDARSSTGVVEKIVAIAFEHLVRA